MILITGCTGYIGHRLAATLLTAGQHVRGLVLPQEFERAAGLAQMGMEVWTGDLLSPETLEGLAQGVVCIYHLAGIHASVERMERVYVQGSRNLIYACEGGSVQACIVASNGAVYGDGGDDWLAEKRPAGTGHPFGTITHSMEQVFLKSHQSFGFPCIILRIAEVYGPGEYNPVQHLQSRHTRLLGDGRNWTSHIHIDDLQLILQLAPTDLCKGEIYNVIDDLPVRQRDLYAYITEQLAVPLPEWIPLDTMPERVRLSIYGLHALSLRMTNAKLKTALKHPLLYATYKEGLQPLLANAPGSKER